MGKAVIDSEDERSEQIWKMIEQYAAIALAKLPKETDDKEPPIPEHKGGYRDRAGGGNGQGD